MIFEATIYPCPQNRHDYRTNQSRFNRPNRGDFEDMGRDAPQSPYFKRRSTTYSRNSLIQKTTRLSVNFCTTFYVHLVHFCFALSNPLEAFVGSCVLGNFFHKKYEKDVENMMIMLTRESPKGTPAV
jgi:hypothetical protein